jgi:hypothetical protein
MITRGPIADYRSWPFGGPAKWGWRDVVYAVPIIVIVVVGLALMPLIEASEKRELRRR